MDIKNIPLTASEREALMLRMRKANIEDSKIGKVFGISRQRIGQLLGLNRHYHKWTEDKTDTAKKMFEDGRDFDTIGLTIGISDSCVRDKLKSIYTRAEWVKVKRLRRKITGAQMAIERDASIKSRILEFKSTLNGNGARPIELMRYSRSLYAVANMAKPVEQWFEECGIEYKRVGRHANS